MRVDRSRRPLFPTGADQRSSESMLVARVREGDTAAFEMIFRRHFEGMFRFAYRLLDRRDLAEEVVQDVFARVWEHRRDWAVAGTIQSYLFCAVRNGAASIARHERVVRGHELEATLAAAVDPPIVESPESEVERMELAAAVRHVIERLPEHTRRVFTLHRQHHLTYPEIAAVMEMTVKGIEYHMGIALRTLRTQLVDFAS